MWFGQKKKEREALKKLRHMSKGTWTCGSCDDLHSGIPDLAMHRPYFWRHGDTKEPNSAIRLDGNFLSDDFCVMEGKNFIVRCVLDIPINDFDYDFAFGVWSSLSKENFEAYMKNFDTGLDQAGVACSSWLCSDIIYFGKTVTEKVWVIPQANRQRPKVELMDKTHPLYKAQHQGLAPSELISIFEQSGHFPK